MTNRFCVWYRFGDDGSLNEALRLSSDATLPVKMLLTACGRWKCLFKDTNDATAAADLMESRSCLNNQTDMT